MSFHTRLTLRASWYAPPDTGVPNLQLVAVEQLLSIEGALEIQMDVTFLRGKAPLAGELSAKLTERLYQICDCPMSPTAPSFPSCRKRRGRKGALGYIWCILPLNLGEALFFRCRSTRWSPYGFFDYAPPDTGVPNLQLVSVEYLPSIEGTLEIQMDVTFLRGRL